MDTVYSQVITILIISVVLLFWGWIFWELYRNRNVPEISQTFIECPLGQCATDLKTGLKRCPTSDTVRINAVAGEEVCNPRTACTDPSTPYAENLDNSTINTGICPLETTCSCFSKPRCPRQIATYFQSNIGNPNSTGVPTSTNNLNNRLTFSPSFGQPGLIVPVPPIQYDDPRTEFCFISSDWLNNDLVVNGSATAGASICPYGILTVQTDLGGNLLQAGNAYQLGCTLAEGGGDIQCPQNQYPIWNNSTNSFQFNSDGSPVCLPIS